MIHHLDPFNEGLMPQLLKGLSIDSHSLSAPSQMASVPESHVGSPISSSGLSIKALPSKGHSNSKASKGLG